MSDEDKCNWFKVRIDDLEAENARLKRENTHLLAQVHDCPTCGMSCKGCRCHEEIVVGKDAENARLRARIADLEDFLSYSGASAKYPYNRLPMLLREQGQRCRNQNDRDYWRFVEEKLLKLVQDNAALLEKPT